MEVISIQKNARLTGPGAKSWPWALFGPFRLEGFRVWGFQTCDFWNVLPSNLCHRHFQSPKKHEWGSKLDKIAKIGIWNVKPLNPWSLTKTQGLKFEGPKTEVISILKNARLTGSGAKSWSLAGPFWRLQTCNFWALFLLQTCARISFKATKV